MKEARSQTIESTEPVYAVSFDGFYPVIDGIQINFVPAPGSAALMGLSGLIAARRRRS